MPLTATWMDLENIRLSEGNQTKTKVLDDITHMWNLKNNAKNLYTNKNRLSYTENKLTDTKKRKGGDKLGVWD